MKYILPVLLIFITGITCRGQAVGRIYMGDSRMEVPAGTPDHLEFGASSSSMNEEGEQYLRYFVGQYQNAFPGGKVYILVEPTANAREESDKTQFKRIEAVEKVLKKTKIQISKAYSKQQVITINMKLR